MQVGWVTSWTALFAMLAVLAAGTTVMTWFFGEVETGVPFVGLALGDVTLVLFALHDHAGMSGATATTIFVVTAAVFVLAMGVAIVCFGVDVRRDFQALDDDE